MPKYSARPAFLWQLIAKNRREHSNTEHLLQIGNSHFNHLHLVFIKHEKHISITLCDVSNGFRKLAISGREFVFVQRMLVRGGNSVWQMGESVFL